VKIANVLTAWAIAANAKYAIAKIAARIAVVVKIVNVLHVVSEWR
jgi:hypothetical protein